MWWCQPRQVRTSYSSRPTSPLPCWNSVSMGQRLAPTRPSVSSGVSAGAFDSATNPTIFLRLNATSSAPREIAWDQFGQRYAPIITAVIFLRQGDRFAICFAVAWLGINLVEVSVYIADARAHGARRRTAASPAPMSTPAAR